MDRSRSKRYYYDQSYDFETLPPPRTKPRYSSHNNPPPPISHHHRRSSGGGGAGGAGGGGRKPVQDSSSSVMVTTNYRILCHDAKAGGVIGKSGSIIKAIRQHTGAWINVHELMQGDDERIIEISDTRRRDPEGRIPSFSPAQEALFLIHDRILESTEGGGNRTGFGNEDDDEGYGPQGGRNRAVTRLVVSRMHVGCLLGKAGKIIEQMKVETKTHIRVLPRDHTLPRCVAMSEEIVQVVGDAGAVRNAISIISTRLRESQHRDRSNNFQGRPHSPERFLPPGDDFIPQVNNASRRSAVDGAGFGSRSGRGNNYSSRPSGYTNESVSAPVDDIVQPSPWDDLVFQILCPISKVDRVVGESDGITELLQNDIGVDVKVADPVSGSDEQIIIITSDEGPDNELFPAQEALLHIQTCIVDIFPEKENIVTTRLLVPSSDLECLKGMGGSGAKIQILPREQRPVCVGGALELVQIVGEIRAARDALVELTARLRSYVYQECFRNDIPAPSLVGVETASSNNSTPAWDGHSGTGNPPSVSYQNMQKDAGGSISEMVNQGESEQNMPSGLNKITAQTRVTEQEVFTQQYAVPAVITKSRNKLAQIGELSGASVKLVEDKPDNAENMVQISGTREQADRAHSLLQGFILSTQEDI